MTIISIFLLLPGIYVSAESAQQPDTSIPEQKKPETSEGKDDEEPLDFSGTGRPGQQTAGESRGNCAYSAQRPIKALLPVSHSGKTVQGHPKFWIYFPDSAKTFSQVEFAIQNEARQDIWRSRHDSNLTSGYSSFSLPETEAPLEIGQWYRWYVKVYCDSQVASTQYVQGWVKRIPLNSKLYVELDNSHQPHLVYGKHSIWYDAIDRLLTSYQDDDSNLSLGRDWQQFIEAKGVELDLPGIGGSYEAVK